MVLEVSKSIVHNACTPQQKTYSEEELQDIMLRLMGQSGIQQNQVNITNEGTVQLEENSNLKLHRILLEAEKLGLTAKYTKKTLIEIC